MVAETLNQQVNLVSTFLTLLAREVAQPSSGTPENPAGKKAGIEIATDDQQCK